MNRQQNVEIDPATKENVERWLQGPYDGQTKDEIKKMQWDNPKELLDSFYTHLSFGTGGLRGIMGVGCNRMNVYTVRAATQGLANYLNQQPTPSVGHSVFIGYDSRHHSAEFAMEAAKVLAGNNIQVYLCDELRPTPLISFGCRLKKCSAAIMITASHNPPNYNGYKVYWNDGAQILPPHDANIIAEVNKITSPDQVKSVQDEQTPLIEKVGEEVDQAYLRTILALQNYPKDNLAHGDQLRIVYTSLHGTGITLIPKALNSWGFNNISLVASQVVPNGDFPTVHLPNPEEQEALKMGIEQLKDIHGDILIATDPDADRMGVVVMHKGAPHILNGNQIASICLEHICNALTTQGKMDPKAAFIKTIGTTELFKAICDAYGKPCFNVLTGFKYIAEKIREWEEDPNGYHFIFGGEESFGYLLGTQSRDKDAVCSACLIAEVALQAKLQKKTLVDFLNDLYQKYGYFYEKLHVISFDESKAGKEQIAKGMEKLQSNPPTSIAGMDVEILEDYRRSIKTFIRTKETEFISLPKSDVLLFWLKDGSKIMIRPSGTEPKIKIYCGLTLPRFSSLEEAQRRSEELADKLCHDLQSKLQN
jgi:phosphoglucomutase/phosphomannomutase